MSKEMTVQSHQPTTFLDPKAQEKENTLSVMIRRPAYAQRIESLMGKRAPQFVSSLISISQELGADVDAKSILGSAIKAAALDLPIEKSLGFAWIVPYKKWDAETRTEKKLASLQIGYRGYVQLAQRTSKYAGINAVAVNQEVLAGHNRIGEPVLDWEKYDIEKPIAAYVFAFELTSGFAKICVWSKARVEKHASRYSQAFRSGKGTPWQTNFDEMALKTVIRNELPRWGPLSVQVQEAVEADQSVIADVDATPEHPDRIDAESPGQLKVPDFTPRGPQKQVEDKKTETQPEPGPDTDGDLGPEKEQNETETNGRQQDTTGPEQPSAGAVRKEPETKVEVVTPKVDPKPVSVAGQQEQPATTTEAPKGTEPKTSRGDGELGTQRPIAAPRSEATASPRPAADDHSKNVAAMQKHLDEAKLTPAELIAWAVGCGILKGTPPESLATIPPGKLNILLHQPKQTIKATADWKAKHPQA